jgi:hypothetical protein
LGGEHAVGPSAVGDDLGIVGEGGQSGFQLAERDRDGSGDVAGLVLLVGSDVEDQHRAVVLTYALGTGNAEVAMLGVACEPTGVAATPTGKYSSTWARPCHQAVEMIADCDPDPCFTDGLELMLAGLSVSALS